MNADPIKAETITAPPPKKPEPIIRSFAEMNRKQRRKLAAEYRKTRKNAL